MNPSLRYSFKSRKLTQPPEGETGRARWLLLTVRRRVTRHPRDACGEWNQPLETKDSESDLKRTIDFFFEIGMLKKTPRSGFQFLGSGKESVADHTFRAAVIGFSMAKLAGGADPFRVACLCLFHDVPEARTGDLNYLNKRYVDVHESEAIRDLTESLPFADDVLRLLDEYRGGESLEAQLAHDADQLDLILELKQQSDLGNRYALEWVAFARKRLQTVAGKELAEQILNTDFNAWWFEGHDHWWVRR